MTILEWHRRHAGRIIQLKLAGYKVTVTDPLVEKIGRIMTGNPPPMKSKTPHASAPARTHYVAELPARPDTNQHAIRGMSISTRNLIDHRGMTEDAVRTSSRLRIQAADFLHFAGTIDSLVDRCNQAEVLNSKWQEWADRAQDAAAERMRLLQQHSKAARRNFVAK